MLGKRSTQYSLFEPLTLTHRVPVEEPSNELLVDVEIGAGNKHDGKKLLPLIEETEEHSGIEVDAIIGDGAYGTGDNRAKCAKRGIDLISPLAETHGQLSKNQFHIDLERQQVICPEGHTTSRWRWAKDPKKRKVRCFQFPDEVCLNCPRHQECIGEHTKGWCITLHYQEAHLMAAGDRQKREDFQETCCIRSKIERKIGELVRHGLRQSRYIGLEKTELQALWTGAGVNLKHLFKLAEGEVRPIQDALDRLFARNNQPIPLRELCTVV